MVVGVFSQYFNVAQKPGVTLVVEPVNSQMVGGLEGLEAQVTCHLHTGESMVKSYVVPQPLLCGSDDTTLRAARVGHLHVPLLLCGVAEGDVAVTELVLQLNWPHEP